MPDQILHWELTHVPSGRTAYYAEHPGGGGYCAVWEDPCWCLRFEARPGQSIRWMGQFMEPGGLMIAKARAQADFNTWARAEAWRIYMLENDPPLL